MKTVCPFFFALFFSFSIFGINSYKSGDTLTVWAEGGLNIRDTNSLSAKKIGLIPYGEKLVVLESKIRTHWSELKIPFIEPSKFFSQSVQKEHVVPGFELTGKWVKIKFGEVEGYVFDGYLSKLPAPRFELNFGQEAQLEWLETYLTREFGRTRIDSFFIKKFDQIRYAYQYGETAFREVQIEKSGDSKWVFPDLSLEEIMIFMKYGPMRWQRDEAYDLYAIDNKQEFGMKILQFKNKREQSEITIISVNGTIILLSSSWC